MSHSLRRRDFLYLAPAAAAVGSGFSGLGLAVQAADAPARRGTKFKFSLAAYSYRSLLAGKEPKLTLFDFADDCAKLQLEGTELTSYYFPADVTPEYLRKLKAHCFRLGLDVSGTAIGNDFGHPAGEKRQEQIESAKRWIDRAEILGAPVIRIFAGHVQKGSTDDEAHKLMVAGMEECCEYAGQHGVFLALENHGGPTATADGLMKLVNDVKSPWFGVNLDTGNFRSEDVYADLARVAKHAINVQVKVVVTQQGKKQPMDFPRLAAILRDAGYRGYVVLEYEEEEDPRVACAEYLEKIRAAFANTP
jgi:sugar phosphate isomerase/epimerase